MKHRWRVTGRRIKSLVERERLEFQEANKNIYVQPWLNLLLDGYRSDLDFEDRKISSPIPPDPSILPFVSSYFDRDHDIEDFEGGIKNVCNLGFRKFEPPRETINFSLPIPHRVAR